MNGRQVIVLIFTVLVFGTFERTLAGEYCYLWNPQYAVSQYAFCDDGCCYAYTTYETSITCCTTTTTEQPEVELTGVIIGSTVGGILFIALFVGVLLCVYYKCTEKNRIKPGLIINQYPESTTPQAGPQHAPPSHLPPLPQTYGPSHGPVPPSYAYHGQQPHQHVTPPTYPQQPVQPRAILLTYGQNPVQPRATPPSYGQQPVQPIITPPTYTQQPVQHRAILPTYGQNPVQPRATPPSYGQQPVQPIVTPPSLDQQPVQPIVTPPSNDQQPGITPTTYQPDPKYHPPPANALYQFDQNGQPAVDIGTPSSNQPNQPPRVSYPTNQHDGALPNTPAQSPHVSEPPPTIHHVAEDPINQHGDTIPSTQMGENVTNQLDDTVPYTPAQPIRNPGPLPDDVQPPPQSEDYATLNTPDNSGNPPQTIASAPPPPAGYDM